MADTLSQRPKVAAIIRVVIGPPALFLVAAMQGVRVTGPITVSLAYPAPPLTLVLSDVLSVLVLATLALWGASVLAGQRRSVASFLVPVAASQLPMAAAALVVGRDVLARAVKRTLAGSSEQLLADPGAALASFVPAAVGALILTALAVGVLYVGYRRATQMVGFRLALSFVGGLIAAEILCRAWFLWTG